MSYFLFFITGAYCVFIISLIKGWRNVKEFPIKAHSLLNGELISVIIPVRNEQNNINNLLQSLGAQHYRNFEVIIIDDHSSDKTHEVILAQLKLGVLPIHFYTLKNEFGKKEALHLGIKKARGTLIVTTDADCLVGVHWLDSIHSLFTKPMVKLVVGGVTIQESNTLFSKMQSIEFASLVGTGAVTLGWGVPTMCNGANLAFRKETFQKVNGYEGNFHVPSGDDEFLLKKIFKLYPQGVIFNSDPASVVSTQAQKGIKEFFYQRIRWAGKWRMGTIYSKTIAIFIFLTQMAIVSSIILMIVNYISVLLGILLLSIKIFIEFIFIKQVMNFLKSPFRWRAFILLQLVYPIYVIIFALAANTNSFEWKGRKLKKNGLT